MSYPLHHHHHCFYGEFSEYTISSCGVLDVTWIWTCFQYAVFDIFLDFPQTMLNFWHSSIVHSFFLNFRANVAHLEDLVYCSFLRYLYELWSLCPKWNSEKLFFCLHKKLFENLVLPLEWVVSTINTYLDIININNSCALSKIEQLAVIYCNSLNFILLRIYH